MDDQQSKAPRPRRTFRLALALLAIVGTLVAVTTGVVIAETYRRSLEVATEMGRRLFENLRTDIAVQQQQLVQPIEFAIAILSEDPSLGAGHAEDLRLSFLAVLAGNPQIIELRAAYAGGELFAVANIGSADDPLRVSIGAPPEAKYASRRVARDREGQWRLTWTYIGADHTNIGTRSEPVGAPDYGTEPWYAGAVAMPRVIVQTKATILSPQGALGISFARSFTGSTPGVIATDMSLARLSDILKYLKFDQEDQIFLFDDDRMLLASPDVEVAFNTDGTLKHASTGDLPHPIVGVMLDRFKASGSYASELVKTGTTEFLASVIRLGEQIKGRPGTYLAFATPATTFTGRFVDITRETALVSLLILLAATPVIVWVARRAARPLAALGQITDAIARFELAEGAGVGSRIREIDHLDRSISNMRNALSQIAKFVPKALLQDLVKSGTKMEVGGERRELSLVFTDVRDFTPMAEAMRAEDLMAQMSSYFDALVGEILQLRGTIDKYVGDAIFAFWNAPTLQADHAALACQAALTCRAASNALNERWRGEGRPVWYTRFGVHSGEAVVGNVGSRDRLDYTAIGNAVNMAARLEGLNKYYGTQILVSGAIKEAVGDQFLFRPIDRVIAKGAATPMAVFELMCRRDEASAALVARCEAWTNAYRMYRARAWQGAYDILLGLTAADADDHAAVIFRDRIAAYLAAPPADWNGVTRLDTK